ncbi:GNAT family N-acetyltransferase [Miniphocaeibacter halophilus]|uniref:GNAT family N-acetyltransferase n=1 Tax=Miniphocaeibacter halophilus TaxID=2931922 RepID=A0AC61MN25_9FIRM|nr:GNAT family N-acetyltransferase [Miniphocaeibacter halophilus]QQK07000.1 GNAT family N-acetyltransferase [Miniphocaeibacter halophilus]
MEIEIISNENKLWNKVINYADNCSWVAGKFLAINMRKNNFTSWERVIAVIDNNNIIGFSTLTKKDGNPNLEYGPFIGFVFVDEKYRGNRISEEMINTGLEYFKLLNFNEAYIISEESGLYEKYGFKVVQEKQNNFGNIEKIFKKEL